MRPIGLWTYELRSWQNDCFGSIKRYYEGSRKSFLADVTPAGGKTTEALRTAFYFLQMRYALRVVVVVHTEYLKQQWALAAHKYEIDLDPNFRNNGQWKESNDYHGIVVTYQQVGADPLLHQMAVDRIPTLVIIDEIHHAGEELNWGSGIRTAYENAVFVLALTGTAFRSDDNPIPFVTYRNNVSKADYRYSYTQAILDGVCRPIYFSAYDGLMKWNVDGKLFKATFEEALDEARTSERLRTALDPENSEVLEHMIRDADAKLDYIRNVEHHEDAGGLINCIDQNHARKVSDLLFRLADETANVVISDDSEASNYIRQFKESRRKWIIAVKMISEGVDIPRLRVGVHATNVTEDLFFRQEVGRFVRIQNFGGKQDAFLYIPKDPRLVKLAQEIEEEREHALIQRRDDSTSPASDDDDKEKKEFESISAVITDKTQYELSFADTIANMFQLNNAQAVGIAREVKNETGDPLFEQRMKLRDEINREAKLAAARSFRNQKAYWEFFHKEWIKRGGKPIEQETIEELQERLKWVKQQ